MADYFLVHIEAGTIEVDEGTASKLLRLINEWPRPSQSPCMVKFKDLHGGDFYIRLSSVNLITRWTPEWRDNYREFRRLHDDDDSAPSWQ